MALPDDLAVDVEGSVAAVHARLALWCRRVAQGFALVESTDAAMSRRVWDLLRKSLAEAGLSFGDIALSPSVTAAGEQAVALTLVELLDQRSEDVVSIFGLAEALPTGKDLPEALYRLSFQRERLAQKGHRQIWWMPPHLATEMERVTPDLASWFLVKLRLDEQSYEVLEDAPREEDGGQEETQDPTEARRRADDAFQRFERALGQGASVDGLLGTLIGPAAVRLEKARLVEEAADFRKRAREAMDRHSQSPPYDFFVSYTAKDRAWAEWIAWQLESEGKSVTIQAWDFRPGNNFVVQMHKAATAAKRTVAVLSPAYLRSEMATAEWAEAFRRDPVGGASTLIGVRVDDFRPDGLLGALVYIDLVGKDRIAARAALLEGVADGRGKPQTPPAFPGVTAAAGETTRGPPPEFPGALPDVFLVPFLDNPVFKGRKVELDALHESLRTDGTTAVTRPHVISGLGGVGKTQLAVKYAYRYAGDYSTVLWVTADAPAVLRSSVAALAGPLGLPAGREPNDEAIQAQAVERWLQANRRWLLIIDNADSPEAGAAVEALLPRLRTGHVIITSRHADWPITVERLSLDVLREQDAVALLRARVPEAGTAADAREVAAAVHFLPLALEQAAAYVRKRGIRFADYLRDFAEARARVLGHRTGGATYKTAVATTWLVTQAHLGPEARTILRLASFLAPDPIPRWLWEKGETVFREAIGSAVSPVPATEDAREMAVRGMGELVEYSLAIWTPDTIVFHRLVALVERDRLVSQDRHVWLELALRLLDAAAGEPSDVGRWSDWELLAPHIAEAVEEADDAGIAFPTSRLMANLGQFFNRKARWSEAEALYRRALAIEEAEREQRAPDVAVLLSHLGHLLHGTNRLGEAESCYRRALAIGEAAFGPRHPFVATRLSNLATLLKDQGEDQQAEAERLLKLALEIDQTSAGQSTSRVSRDLNNLGAVYRIMNRREEAESVLRQALDLDRKLLGDTHPIVATRMANLANLLNEMERPQEAEPLLMNALRVDQVHFGEDHPTVASDLNDLANVLMKVGKLHEAGPLIERALQIHERSFGPDHPAVAFDANSLGIYLRRDERSREAVKYLRRALVILKRSGHPMAAKAVRNYRDLLVSLGGAEASVESEIRAAEDEASRCDTSDTP